MLKDIQETPKVLTTLINTYLSVDSLVQNIHIKTETFSKIYIVASGSSKNTGSIAKCFLEKLTQVPVIVDFASEFAHSKPILSKTDLVIFISQSGETADVIAAMKITKKQSVYTVAITNNEESTIHKLADSSIFIHAGTEISIPATKSFTAQLFCLYVLGIHLAEKKQSIDEQILKSLKLLLKSTVFNVEKIIKDSENIITKELANKIASSKNIVILGRNQNLGLAEEGALKIKETCYINTTGYPTGEFMHGHLAFLDEKDSVISIINNTNEQSSNYELTIKNTKKIQKKRGSSLIIIKDKNDKTIESEFVLGSVYFIDVPDLNQEFSPIFIGLILQILSYKTALILGNDTDNPRSLNKTVSSE